MPTVNACKFNKICLVTFIAEFQAVYMEFSPYLKKECTTYQ